MKASYAVSSNAPPKADGVIEEKRPKEASTFRTILPQILASSAKNLLLLDLGLAVAFPTIVIPVLRGLQNDRNPDEMLHFSAVEASWYGSVAYISQPIGSALSGWITEPIGRKKSMIFVNIPHVIAWTMLYFAKTHEEVFIAAILLGLGVGFMEAPIITYVGEICQPSIRGIVIAISGVAAMLGFFIVYILGTITVWRNVALICLSIPITTVIAICFVPETPLWLLSKNRKAEALLSLQWLRGWVSPAAVEKEFHDMQRYSENSNSCIACQKSRSKCSHPPADLREKLKELVRKRTLRPFLIIMVAFSISQFSGMTSIRPYMVQIFKAYDTPLDANWATVIMGLMGLLANIVCVCIIKVIGKRRLYLFSICGSALSCLALGFYAYNILPAGWSSFDLHESTNTTHNQNYFAMIMFFSLAFFSSVGVTPIPWIILSEVFPFKTRGIATGMTAALNYILTFISVKTYLNIENWLSIGGSMFLYGAISIIGLGSMYILLPETENRTLEEIELYFSDNKRKITDRNIKKSVNEQSTTCEKSNRTVDAVIMNDITDGCDNKAFDK